MNQHTKEYQKNWRKNNQKWVSDYIAKNKEKIKEQSRKRYLRNKTRYDKKRKQWYEKNKSHIISKLRAKNETIDGKICQWKKGAKRRGISWNLTPEFIKSLPAICHYTGLPLTLKVGKNNTMSIDRVDSSTPYEPNNIVPCCAMINTMKQDFGEDEFIRMCRQIVKHQSNK